MSQIRLRIEYASAAWNPYTSHTSQQLTRVQHQAAQFVRSLQTQTSASLLITDFG